MEIEYTPYTLIPKGALNVRCSASVRHGALIRLHSQGCYGYSDCHPWPEMGDLPLYVQLQALAQNKPTPITARALHYASLDLQARLSDTSLLAEPIGIKSHFLISDPRQISTEELVRIRSHGFDCLKLKVGRQADQEQACIEQILSHYPFRLRLDFNNSLDPTTFAHYLQRGSRWLTNVDCIEDPFPFDADAWRAFQESYGISLAADRNVFQAYGHSSSAAILVCKPALYDWRKLFSPHQKILITSYMGHPVGQVIAYYEALQLQHFKPHLHGVGVVSHCVYQKNEFSERFQLQAAKLCFPKEYGWGFDSLLEKQKWHPLTSIGIQTTPISY